MATSIRRKTAEGEKKKKPKTIRQRKTVNIHPIFKSIEDQNPHICANVELIAPGQTDGKGIKPRPQILVAIHNHALSILGHKWLSLMTSDEIVFTRTFKNQHNSDSVVRIAIRTPIYLNSTENSLRTGIHFSHNVYNANTEEALKAISNALLTQNEKINIPLRKAASDKVSDNAHFTLTIRVDGREYVVARSKIKTDNGIIQSDKILYSESLYSDIFDQLEMASKNIEKTFGQKEYNEEAYTFDEITIWSKLHDIFLEYIPNNSEWQLGFYDSYSQKDSVTKSIWTVFSTRLKSFHKKTYDRVTETKSIAEVVVDFILSSDKEMFIVSMFEYESVELGIKFFDTVSASLHFDFNFVCLRPWDPEKICDVTENSTGEGGRYSYAYFDRLLSKTPLVDRSEMKLKIATNYFVIKMDSNGSIEYSSSNDYAAKVNYEFVSLEKLTKALPKIISFNETLYA